MIFYAEEVYLCQLSDVSFHHSYFVQSDIDFKYKDQDNEMMRKEC